MHIVIAQMSHETNTFSPVVTDLGRFARRGGDGPLAGPQALDVFRGTASCVGGYLKVAEAAGATVSIPIAGDANPSGPVEDDAFDSMADRIVDAVRAGCDGLMLDLHGAMVTRSHEDGEGELLRRIRSVAPELPIAVALDLHGNLFPEMVERATVVTGYHTYPHIDMDGTAERAGRILLETLAGRVTPTMVWGNAPMLPHVMRQGTDDFPNSELQKRAQAIEAEGALAASVFAGFPHADISQAGLSVVVVSDGDAARAAAWRDELLDSAWENREAFVYRVDPLEESVARARSLGEQGGPVVLLDHYDNCASGGTMDTTEVLAEILRQGLEDVAFFGFFDPAVVETMDAVGEGASVTVELGARLPMPALELQSKPLTLTGRVKQLGDGSFPATVAMNRGLTLNMGRCGVLSVEGVDIVVISRHLEPFDPGCFRALGIEPTERRFLALKSRVHYRVGFKPIAKAIVECAGLGVCTSDYSEVTFENVRRPIYPLDALDSREPR